MEGLHKIRSEGLIRDRSAPAPFSSLHRAQLLDPGEENFPASLFDKKQSKDDGNHDAVRYVKRCLHDAVIVRGEVSGRTHDDADLKD